MIKLEAFLQQQEKIYRTKFKDMAGKIKSEGLLPSPYAQERDGYLLVLEHDQHFREQCAYFSQRIGKIVPSVVYSPEAIHTTILTYGMQMRPAAQQSSDEKIIEMFTNSFQSRKNNLPSVSIPYGSLLYNQDSVIVQGIAGEDFVELANALTGSFEATIKFGSETIRNASYTVPWSGHVTVARLAEKVPGEKLNEFLALLEEIPLLGVSTPAQVSIGYITVKGRAVNFEVKEQIPLF